MAVVTVVAEGAATEAVVVAEKAEVTAAAPRGAAVTAPAVLAITEVAGLGPAVAMVPKPAIRVRVVAMQKVTKTASARSARIESGTIVQIASALGRLNAAHASATARLNASSNSAVGYGRRL